MSAFYVVVDGGEPYRLHGAGLTAEKALAMAKIESGAYQTLQVWPEHAWLRRPCDAEYAPWCNFVACVAQAATEEMRFRCYASRNFIQIFGRRDGNPE